MSLNGDKAFKGFLWFLKSSLFCHEKNMKIYTSSETPVNAGKF